MTTPPTHDEFENDPTGMGALLRAQPDPGPMPAAVSDSILAALAQEQSARPPSGNVTPLTRLPAARVPATPAAGPTEGSAESADAPTPDARTTDAPTDIRSAGGNNRWLKVVGGLVAAAVVGTVAVVGVNSLGGNNAPTTAAPSTAGTGHVDPDQVAAVTQVSASSINYTAADFNQQAASMAASPVRSPDPAQIAQFGSLASPKGIIACVGAIGTSLLDHPDKVRVDLATYDGKPAVIVVVTKGSVRTAFAVSTTCSESQAPLVAPRTI
ncbi:hypothetical protein [Rudaeicoccus suwonensis]|uniref:Uncharacterized protein n=1 Tax=Rudaeicoccus suwonensis TaxID=657409 RepID=A0A561E418_9MICO|nr:hypothetical protein [Rudaeicoccus suwonensis]TWE10331.1 hypothetical protein BKA23_2687 [Rudaeicoccus suwonensis]